MLSETKVVSIATLTRANLLLHGIAYLVRGGCGFFAPLPGLAGLGLLAHEPPPTFRLAYGGSMLAIALIFLSSAVIRGLERIGLLSIIIVMALLIVIRRIVIAPGDHSE